MRSKWNNVIVLSCNHEHSQLTQLAKKFIKKHYLPPSRNFFFRKKSYDDCLAKGVHSLRSVQSDYEFNLILPNALQSLADKTSKLIIISTGSAQGLCMDGKIYSAAEVAQLLYEWGLREVGVIAFKGRHLGEGNFLETLRYQLIHRWHIDVGWLIGYKHLGMSMNQSFAIKGPDFMRVKRVPGNIPVQPSQGTSRRYPELAELDDEELRPLLMHPF